ncbi:c-type cytochrome [Candidatus Marinarcus aquaticus]|nr:c-type cytochrome [Candidatus Marinarcus aquaticus]
MIKKSLIVSSLLLSSIALQAQTTMCFKENHKDMITIENTRLDGGACAGNKSAKDMKSEGWMVDDIKITPTSNGSNYIYIFKKESGLQNVSEEELMDKLYKKLENEKKAKEEKAKQDLFVANSKAGEALYTSKCANCHGDKGELRAKGVSKPLNTLDHNEFQHAIKAYNNGERNSVMSILMKPYAGSMDYQDIKNVYTYLKSINSEKN